MGWGSLRPRGRLRSPNDGPHRPEISSVSNTMDSSWLLRNLNYRLFSEYVPMSRGSMWCKAGKKANLFLEVSIHLSLSLWYKHTLAAPKIRKSRNGHPKGYWKDINHRRQFFEEYARERGFDPHVARNWRIITATHLIATKGAGPLYLYNSMPAALQATFPELDFSCIYIPPTRTQQILSMTHSRIILFVLCACRYTQEGPKEKQTERLLVVDR